MANRGRSWSQAPGKSLARGLGTIDFQTDLVHANAAVIIDKSGRERELVDVSRHGLEHVPAEPGRDTVAGSVISTGDIECRGEVVELRQDRAIGSNEIAVEEDVESWSVRVDLAGIEAVHVPDAKYRRSERRFTQAHRNGVACDNLQVHRKAGAVGTSCPDFAFASTVGIQRRGDAAEPGRLHAVVWGDPVTLL